MLEGLPSLFLLQLQRDPHVAVVAVALAVGLLRLRHLTLSARLGLFGLLLVLAHFVASVLLLQMGSTGCQGCMTWPVGTHMALSDHVLPAVLAAAWLLVAVGLLRPGSLWPNNSSKPTPLRGAA